MRDKVIGILKLTIAFAIVGWMVQSGRIDFAKLSIFISRPEVAVAGVLQFLFATTFMTSLRWRLLLNGIGIMPKVKKLLSLQLIGQFFNVSMPGSVGGDLVKALYVVRGVKNIPKTRVMMTVLLDRILGMTGVFTIGLLGILWNFDFLWGMSKMRPLIICVGLSVIGAAVFVYFIAGPYAEKATAKLLILSERKIPLVKIFYKVFEAMSLYRGRYRILIGGWALSVAVQATAMGYFAFIASRLAEEPLGFSVLMVIFPIGVLSSALPLAPGGIGVGHLAFEKLYNMVGATGGADVFNIFLLGSLGLSLLGCIPYMLYRADPIYGPVSEPDASSPASTKSTVDGNLVVDPKG